MRYLETIPKEKYPKNNEFDYESIIIQATKEDVDKLMLNENYKYVYLRDLKQEEFDYFLNKYGNRPFELVSLGGKTVYDLSNVEKLTNTKYIKFIWNTKAIGLWDMRKNKSLLGIHIEDFSKLRSIEGIEDATNLEELILEGGMWNALKIETLKPISNLTKLKYLRMWHLKTDDESLEPLVNLTNLEEINMWTRFPVEEYAKLSVKLKNTKCNCFQPYIKFERSRINSAQADLNDILIVGKGKPFLDSRTQAERIEKYVKEFKKLQEIHKRIAN